MNKKYSWIILFFTLFAGTAVFPVFGWGTQNEASFLNWYEKHKDTGGEFTLSGTLYLTKGRDDTPIILDGTGKIKINCGRNEIVVTSPVVIDNPGLEIVSQAGYGLVLQGDGDLGLVSGKLTVCGENGICWMGGKLHGGLLSGGSSEASPSDAGLNKASPSDASPYAADDRKASPSLSQRKAFDFSGGRDRRFQIVVLARTGNGKEETWGNGNSSCLWNPAYCVFRLRQHS